LAYTYISKLGILIVSFIEKGFKIREASLYIIRVSLLFLLTIASSAIISILLIFLEFSVNFSIISFLEGIKSLE